MANGYVGWSVRNGELIGFQEPSVNGGFHVLWMIILHMIYVYDHVEKYKSICVWVHWNVVQ